MIRHRCGHCLIRLLISELVKDSEELMTVFQSEIFVQFIPTAALWEWKDREKAESGCERESCGHGIFRSPVEAVMRYIVCSTQG